jgi:hypothetical protein
MNEPTNEGQKLDTFQQIGLTKDKIGDVVVYRFEAKEDQSSQKILTALRELITNRRVAVEVGPGNQIDSLLFAGIKSNADLVVGIDVNFPPTEKFKPPSTLPNTVPQIVLIKGNAWNRGIVSLFRPDGEGPPTAVYSQLVAPDSLMTETMINMTTPLGKAYMIVLDSGSLDSLSTHHYQPHEIQRKLLTEEGIKDPTQLDWIKQYLRYTQRMELQSQDYQRGVLEGKYPPTQFLRSGRMMIFEKLK